MVKKYAWYSIDTVFANMESSTSASAPKISWIEHVKRYKEQTGKSWKESLVGAKDTWQKSVRKVTKKKGGDWKGHLKTFRAMHPHLSLKECMKLAKETYNRDSAKPYDKPSEA